MRLSAVEIRAVEVASREAFPSGTRVLLFGSRLDDHRRGGDIDLLVELPTSLAADEVVRRRSRFTSRLYRLLEEQRIDVLVVAANQDDPRPVAQAARQQGVELTST
jgi:predicted nucleotidyltransferase